MEKPKTEIIGGTYTTYAEIKVVDILAVNNPFYGKIKKTYKVGEHYEYDKLKLDPTDVPPVGFHFIGEVHFKPTNNKMSDRSYPMEIEITRFSFDMSVVYDDENKACYCEYQFNLDFVDWYCRLDVTFKCSEEEFWVVDSAQIKVWIVEEEFGDDTCVNYIGEIEDCKRWNYYNYYYEVKMHIPN